MQFAGLHRRLRSLKEIEEMIRNEATLRKGLKDSVRVKRIEPIRVNVNFTSEELERV